MLAFTRAAALLMALAIGASTVQAAVPREINYQGYLTATGGTPVNATVKMVLTLYDASSGGNAVYTETHDPVTVTNGVFNVLIGSPTPILGSVLFDVPYWLGITVGTDAEMTPRQPIAASGYSIRSATTEALAAGATVPASQITTSVTGLLKGSGGAVTAGVAGADFVAPNAAITGATNTRITYDAKGLVTVGAQAQFADLGGTITTTQLADGAVTAAKLASNSCTAGQMFKYNGSAWACAADDNSASGGAAGQVLAGTGSAPAWSDSPSLSGTLTLSTNAGNGGTHAFGEYHRDNAIQAWAVVNAPGSLAASYGVASLTHVTGIYTFTLQVGAIDNTRLAVVATPEIDAPPTSASAVRLISIDTINGTTFIVYITNGNYVLTDNDFSVIVTGR